MQWNCKKKLEQDEEEISTEFQQLAVQNVPTITCSMEKVLMHEIEGGPNF